MHAHGSGNIENGFIWVRGVQGIINYTELGKPHHQDVTVYIQDYSIHSDPFFDFLVTLSRRILGN